MSRPMCVAQVLPELNVGGVERGTIEIASALVEAGHRALVVSGGGTLVDELEAVGAEHVTLDVGRKNLLSLRHIARLKALFADEAVDIVHARSRLPAWLAYLARARIDAARRPRWITTVHGPYSVNRYSRIMVSGEAVIAISDFIRDYIEQNYSATDPARIHIVPRGVDTTRYPYGFAPDATWLQQWRSDLPQLADKVLLTLPARLTRWKGQLNFVELVAALKARGHKVHGLLVGGAHAKKVDFELELKRAVAERGLNEDISLLGNRRDLREILSISNCAFSLTNEPEAFGRTTIEALSLGVPVIGYDHGGTGEILARVFPEGLVNNGNLSAAVAATEALLKHRYAVPRDHPYTARAMQQATLAVYAGLLPQVSR